MKNWLEKEMREELSERFRKRLDSFLFSPNGMCIIFYRKALMEINSRMFIIWAFFRRFLNCAFDLKKKPRKKALIY